MKIGYSFGGLASFVETVNNTTVKLTGIQMIDGIKTFSSNPISSAAQGTGGSYLTRKDYVDGALALKAPLASPVFTGNPTAPTAALFDGDTTIATTAFVQRALGNHQKYVWTADATVQPAWAGCFIWYAGAGTLHLTSYANVPVGATLEIMCTGNGAITAQSGEVITLPNGTQVNSVTPLAGDTVKFVRLDTSWAYSGTSYTPTAAASDNSTRPASTAHVKNYLLSSPQLAGNVHVEGVVNATGEYQTTNATGYRIAYGDYGSFWYFDNWSTYLMFTNSGDKWGGFNSLRPFSADCRNGRVTMSNGVSVAGGLVVDDGLTVTGGVTFNQHLSTKQFNYVDGPWAVANWDMSIANNYSFGGLYDSNFGAVGGGDYFLPILSGSVATTGEGCTTRVKFGIHTNASQSGWLRKNAGIWVGSGEGADHPHYLYKFNVHGGFTTGAVTSDTTITAGTNISAGGTISAPFLVSTAVEQGGLRFTGGRYGIMCFNDLAESFYFLLTNIDDQLGGFNGLRPFIINKRTGSVSHQHGLSVGAGLWTDQVHISSTTNSAPTQAAGTNNTTIATTAFVQSMKIEVAKMLYPIGSYYANDSNSANPATLFGFGTWVRVEGRTLMGCDGTGAGTFGTPGSQDGALTHTHTAQGTAITVAQMPSHGHTINMSVSGTGSEDRINGYIHCDDSDGTSPLNVPTATHISANSTGGGQTHTHTLDSASSLQPYRVVYLWRRTA